MALSIITAQFQTRDPALKWEELGPGLYPNEIAVALTSGEKVAVSVDPTWLENGSGVVLDGNARWIDDTGRTKLAPDDAHVEANLKVTATTADVKAFGLKPLAKDVAIMLLGEGPRLNRPADAALGVLARPVFNVDASALANVSVKNAADSVKAMAAFKLSLA